MIEPLRFYMFQETKKTDILCNEITEIVKIKCKGILMSETIEFEDSIPIKSIKLKTSVKNLISNSFELKGIKYDIQSVDKANKIDIYINAIESLVPND